MALVFHVPESVRFGVLLGLFLVYAYVALAPRPKNRRDLGPVGAPSSPFGLISDHQTVAASIARAVVFLVVLEACTWRFVHGVARTRVAWAIPLALLIGLGVEHAIAKAKARNVSNDKGAG